MPDEPESDALANLDAIILVEQAKREAAEVLQRYEQELFSAGRYAEMVQLGVLRYLLTAPIDFLRRLDAMRAAFPEIDRVQTREELHRRLDQWRRQVDHAEHPLRAEGGDETEGSAGGENA